MRFLVDAQLPPALARRLESLGHAAEHVADRGLSQATDSEVRKHAAQTDATIITKDEDFAVHRVLHEGPPVVWVRIGNSRRAVLLERFETELSTIVAALERGETIVELT